MDPGSKRLRVSVTDGRGRAVRDGGLARWLEVTAPARARGELAIALATDAQVRALNRRFRRQNAPTDVLSFPAGDVSNRASAGASGASGSGWSSAPPRPASAPLGDIVIATGLARRQAARAGHSYRTELRVLALHGLLHLLGYDHHEAGDAGRMARAEARLQKKGRLPLGLIERARGSRSGARRTDA